LDTLFTDFISGIDFGEVQCFKNLQIIPLFTEGEEGQGEIRADYSGQRSAVPSREGGLTGQMNFLIQRTLFPLRSELIKPLR